MPGLAGVPDEASLAAPQPHKKFLVVGLGNPGPEYEHTYHNLGFLALDRLAARQGVRVSRKECQALVGRGTVAGAAATLAKPQTYMNLSGSSVRRLLERSELAAGNLIVIHDDLAFPWGTLRIRARGSSGGHKGVQSVLGEVKTDEFVRLRLGIHPGREVGDGAEFVLAPMRRAQLKELDGLLSTACEAVESIISEGVEKAMTRFNRRAQGSKAEEE
jgi:peptidyl-tRNA hydrolase, PTH1 family